MKEFCSGNSAKPVVVAQDALLCSLVMVSLRRGRDFANFCAKKRLQK